MAKIYYDLINKGLWEIKDVPPRWRDEVQAILDAAAGEKVAEVEV